MVEIEHKPVDCPKCGRGYKTGFFEYCPHCGAPTGEKKVEEESKPVSEPEEEAKEEVEEEEASPEA